MRRVLPIVVLLLALLAPSASAHAVLQSADPAVNGHANGNVTLVTLRFTEDVERQYTDADVIDEKGVSVKTGPVQFDASDHAKLLVPVGPLYNGIFSVSWQTLSVDSHTARGSFLFTVGATQLKTPAPPEVDHSAHTGGNVAKEGFARAVFFAGLFLALGLPLFLLVVDRAAGLPSRAFLTAGLFGLLGAAAAGLGLLFLAARTGIPLAAAATTEAGTSFVWRGALLAAASVAALAAAALPLAPRRAAAWLAVLLAAGALVATSLGSHAAADKDERVVSVAADILHLLMAAVWVGGVVGFLHTVWGRSAQDVGKVVVRFTPLAVGSVVVLLATGTWASLRHIPTFAALWLDPYGRLVALKILLLGVLVLIGAYNKEILGPRLQSGRASPRFFRRVLQVEAFVMVCVLAAAGVLASTSPPDKGVEEGTQGTPQALELSNFTKTTHVVLQIEPNPPTVGLQRIYVQLHPLAAGGIPNSTIVAIKVAAPGEPEPDTTSDLEKLSVDTWAGEDSYFTSPGAWRVWVLMQRPDEFKKLEFTIDVKSPS